MKDKSSRSDMFCKKVVLRNFTKFTGKHLCQSLFLIKLQASGLNRCFPVNFVKFLITTFLTEHLRWLLLERLHVEEQNSFEKCTTKTELCNSKYYLKKLYTRL